MHIFEEITSPHAQGTDNALLCPEASSRACALNLLFDKTETFSGHFDADWELKFSHGWPI